MAGGSFVRVFMSVGRASPDELAIPDIINRENRNVFLVPLLIALGRT
jgi:hypothetical protein